MKTSDLLAWVALVWSIIVWLSLTFLFVIVAGMFSLTDRFNGSHTNVVLGSGFALFALEAALVYCIWKRAKPWSGIAMLVWLVGTSLLVSAGDWRSLPLCFVFVFAIMAPVLFLAVSLMLERKKTSGQQGAGGQLKQ